MLNTVQFNKVYSICMLYTQQASLDALNNSDSTF